MRFTTKAIAFSAVIAALYVVLTIPLGELAYASTINIRPAEALTILPMLFPPATFGLFVGCFIANIPSAFGPLDMILGSVVTLVAAFATSKCKNVFIGAIPPVLLNAIFLPFVWMAVGADDLYFAMFFSVLITQAIWVYGLGVPLYYVLKRTRIIEILGLEKKNKD